MFEQKILLFLSVVKNGSFSGAAKENYISQSAVSQAMNKLEDELNIKLFDRSGYRPKLTNAGSYYYDALSKMVGDYDNIVKNMHNIAMNSQKITIAITNDFEKKHIQRIIKAFKQEHDVKIAVKRCSPNESLSLLQDQKVNISIGMDTDLENEKNITSHILYQCHVCIVCSTANPLSALKQVSIEQLKEEPVVLLTTQIDQKTYNKFMNAFKLDEFIPHIVKECEDIDDYMMSIGYDEGIGYTIEELCEESEDIVCIPLLNSHHESTISIAVNAKEDNKYVDLLSREIQKYFTQLSKDYK